ncbi:hypothetical protein [Planifilum fulgidum]|uniref:hypothetical protein n=1 Tax=Planifilum fulgidum TaxID=201973 RepID=UPI001160B61E|nr:hypothetical protein [Planifilum fulgidum]
MPNIPFIMEQGKKSTSGGPDLPASILRSSLSPAHASSRSAAISAWISQHGSVRKLPFKIDVIPFPRQLSPTASPPASIRFPPGGHSINQLHHFIDAVSLLARKADGKW